MNSTLVRLLAYVLKADPKTALGRDYLDSILGEAWNELTNQGRGGILSLDSDAFRLKCEELSFVPMREAWICPVTRRFLDTTLCKITPYLPRHPEEKTAICKDNVSRPIYDIPFGGTTDVLERMRKGREWLANTPAVKEQREDGLWSTLNDRVIELPPYFITAEHSGQQEARLLDRYQREFKEGKINLLSCSTTMEMGIDIGGIQIVAMNNVPPHPANYLQRAGRAGRRQETRSTAITLCKTNPHDQHVFANSLWAFKTSLPTPCISLHSKIIVQRHVNAMILGHFLSHELGKDCDKRKITCGLFFIKTAQGLCQRFQDWCKSGNAARQKILEKGLLQLTRKSALEHFPIDALIANSGKEMELVEKRWMDEWKAFEQTNPVMEDNPEKTPEDIAIAHRKKRLSGEYLLKELMSQGYLPAYGFPAYIAAFDKLTIGETNKRQHNPNSREDNRFQRRDLAGRDLVTALREYAPGADVVIDGLVYRSGGVTLNWHIPASEQKASETQAIQFAWRCNKCGSSGTTASIPKLCTDCKSSRNRKLSKVS